MKLVYLDYHTLNPRNDLSWKPLTDLPVEVVLYERTDTDNLVERAHGAQLLLTNKTRISQQMAELEDLRYIGVTGTGFDIIDIKAATSRGITVTNVPGYGTSAVAQHTFALLLELTNHVQKHAETVAAGEWTRSPDWCYWRWPILELAGKVMGIVGFGKIGRQVAQVATCFGMTVRYSSSSPQKDEAWRPIEELFKGSDVISLHCPLTNATRGLINKHTLQLVKPCALLLNTSRGALVVADDLANALNEGRLAGAGLDVLPEEPPPCDQPLLAAKNCLITPHLAWAAREARQRLLTIAAQNVEAFLKGQPVNVVNC
jgi:glycerate dehydrogenase